MIKSVLGIGLAVVAHGAILLFGGLLFLSPPSDPLQRKPIQEVDLLEEGGPEERREARKGPRQEQPEKAGESDRLHETDEAPDLSDLLKLDAAAAAPALDAVSLSALADSLSPALAAGEGFFGEGVSLESGGRIGGTGRAMEPGSLDRIFSMADLDQRPRAIVQSAPSYPYDLRRRRIEGSVQLVFVVDEQGRVTHPTVENASHPEFERAVLEAVRQWRFEPAVREGKKVQCRMRVPLRFTAG